MKRNPLSVLLLAICLFVTGCTPSDRHNHEAVTEEALTSVVDDPIPVDHDLEEEEYYLPEIIPLPKYVPLDIVSHFSTLEASEDALPIVRNPMDGEIEHIHQTLFELQKYSDGKRKYYPVDDVERSLNYLSAYACHHSGHGSDDCPEIRQVNNYQNHFAAIAAMLCPELDFMTTLKDADRTLGIRQFRDWSSTGVIKTYVYLPKGKGLTLKIMDELNAVTVQKIFRLKDPRGRVYYLFSNDDDLYRFGQVLYLWNNGRLEHITTFTGLEGLDVDDDIILFNPRTLEWNFCYMDASGYLHKIPHAPYVKLTLSGKKSSIRVIGMR